jgi:hypothetical protein
LQFDDDEVEVHDNIYGKMNLLFDDDEVDDDDM